MDAHPTTEIQPGPDPSLTHQDGAQHQFLQSHTYQTKAACNNTPRMWDLDVIPKNCIDGVPLLSIHKKESLGYIH